MNILPIALGLIAIKAMGNGSLNGNMNNITNLLNDDAKSMVNSIGTLTDKSSTDKTGALLNVITNPAVIALASNIFGKVSSNSQPKAEETTQSYSQPSEKHEETQSSQSFSQSDIASSNLAANNQSQNINLEDNNIVDYEGASREAVSFFQPVSNIAGQEVSAKLYKIYDNWYSRRAN